MAGKSEWSGTGKVFSFTLRQQCKSRASIITMAILLIFAIAAMPVLSLVYGKDTGPGSLQEISTVYLVNDTGYTLPLSAYAPAGGQAADAAVHVYKQDGAYHIDIKADAKFNSGTLGEAVTEALYAARVAALGVSEEHLAGLSAGYDAKVYTMTEFTGKAREIGMDGSFAVTYAYSILVMMLCIFSASYIIHAVIQEKASKLVELLMVSVQPLALLLGKILAVMCFVFGSLLLIAAGFFVSFLVTSRFMDTSFISGFIGNLGLADILAGLGGLILPVILISLLLGYATFALLAGLAGTGCSSMDDMQGASLTVTMTAMVGYLAAAVQAAFEGKAAALVFSLLPVFSIFCAPANYILGRIGLGELALSWLIQACVVWLLARLTAKTYRSLILYKGERMKWKKIIGLAKGGVRG